MIVTFHARWRVHRYLRFILFILLYMYGSILQLTYDFINPSQFIYKCLCTMVPPCNFRPLSSSFFPHDFPPRTFALYPFLFAEQVEHSPLPKWWYTRFHPRLEFLLLEYLMLSPTYKYPKSAFLSEALLEPSDKSIESYVLRQYSYKSLSCFGREVTILRDCL